MKRFLATLIVAPLALSSTAFARPEAYINLEVDSSIPNGEYSNTQTLLHVGYKDVKGKFGYFIQGGPNVIHLQGHDDPLEYGFSSKTGVTYASSRYLTLYGELYTYHQELTPQYDDLGVKTGIVWSF